MGNRELIYEPNGLIADAFELGVDIKILTKTKAYYTLSVLHLIEDSRSMEAIRVALDFVDGISTREDLLEAANSAYDAYQLSYRKKDDKGEISLARYYATYAAYDTVRNIEDYENTPCEFITIEKLRRITTNVASAIGHEYKYKNKQGLPTPYESYHHARHVGLTHIAND